MYLGFGAFFLFLVKISICRTISCSLYLGEYSTRVQQEDYSPWVETPLPEGPYIT